MNGTSEITPKKNRRKAICMAGMVLLRYLEAMSLDTLTIKLNMNHAIPRRYFCLSDTVIIS